MNVENVSQTRPASPTAHAHLLPVWVLPVMIDVMECVKELNQLSMVGGQHGVNGHALIIQELLQQETGRISLQMYL